MLFCALIVLVVMFPTINNGWVNWDDELFILNNPLVDVPSFQQAKEVFTTPQSNGGYTPLVIMSWSMDYAIDGYNPKVFHVTNLLIHLLNVILVFSIVHLLSKRIQVAVIVAILFGVHPMQLEAVAWVTARKDLLYSLFYLLGLLTYVRYLDKKEFKFNKQLGLCLLFFLCSLFSKGMAVTFPVVLILLDLVKGRTFNKSMLLEKAPFFVLSLLFGILAVSGQEQVGAVDDAQNISGVQSFFVASYGVTQYFIKSLIPYQLSPFHPYPYSPGEEQPWYIVASIVPAILIVVGSFYLFYKNRKLGAGLLFFLISMALVLQLFPVGVAIIAERFSYLGYVGLFLLFALIFTAILDRYKQYKTIGLIVGLGYVVFLGSTTFQRSQIWTDSETLWTEVINKYPEDFIAYANRAEHYKKNGEVELALLDYAEALKVNASSVQVYMDRGEVYLNRLEMENAINDFNQVIELAPQFGKGYTNRGLVYLNVGEMDLATSDFNKGIELEPNAPLNYYNRGLLNKVIGNTPLAIQDLKKAVELSDSKSKEFVSTNYELATLYLGQGNLLEAQKALEEVIMLEENHADALTNLGLIHLNLKQYDRALLYLNRTITVNGGHYSSFFNRGLVYLFSNNFSGATLDFNQCLQIVPNSGEAYYWRSVSYEKQGKLPSAYQDALRARDLNYPVESSYLESLAK